jgi:hypothetical protein
MGSLKGYKSRIITVLRLVPGYIGPSWKKEVWRGAYGEEVKSYIKYNLMFFIREFTLP